MDKHLITDKEVEEAMSLPRANTYPGIRLFVEGKKADQNVIVEELSVLLG